jgi:hypothetical protein
MAGRGRRFGFLAVLSQEARRHRTGNENNSAVIVAELPGNENLAASETNTQEAEALFEVGDAGLLLVQFKASLVKYLGYVQPGLLRRFLGLAQQKEIVGIADEVVLALFEALIDGG